MDSCKDRPAQPKRRSQEDKDMIYPSTTISVQIAREPAAVYAFVAALGNFPTWATTFCQSIRIAPENCLGVLDHYVTPAAGETLYVPLRVVANGSGSEVLFTLFRLPGVSDESYAADAALVRQDLTTLKVLLER